LNIKNHDGKWTQEYGTNAEELITVDLKSASEDALSNLIKDEADKIQRSLDIEKGEIAKFVLIETPETQTHNRIFIVVHHLAIDGVSWRIILDDLELLLTKLSNGEKPELGVKSSSYRQWFKALEEYGQSKRALSQKKYWEKTESGL
jgi:NRPS condensation-like uncharacterized protein